MFHTEELNQILIDSIKQLHEWKPVTDIDFKSYSNYQTWIKIDHSWSMKAS